MTGKKTKDLCALALSVFVSLWSLEIFKSHANKDLETLGGGFQEAIALNHVQFICDSTETSCIQEISKTFEINKKDATLLILGNSQTGAINQKKDGDLTYAQIVAKHLNAKAQPTRSVWMPNASLKEFKMLYEAISECGSEPRHLVIPVFLDDTRESSVRGEVSQLKSKICLDSTSKMEKKNLPINGHRLIPRDKNSERLSSEIKKRLPLFSGLPSLNAIFRGNIYFLRNTVLGINASSKRKILAGSYSENMSSLEEMINRRSEAGNKTFVYIPPLLYAVTRPFMIPYVIQEYQSFKQDVADMCQMPNCKFVNLEGVVPDDEWGMKASTNLGSDKEELDFMHFTGLGHKRLSKVLLKELKHYFRP